MLARVNSAASILTALLGFGGLLAMQATGSPWPLLPAFTATVIAIVSGVAMRPEEKSR